jgi:cytochrome c-type biogenesis protein CcmH
VQTLDVHESDLADKLRHEIDRRLSAGEPAQQIEDDLVARYGERIRAVPRDADPRSQIPLAVGLALCAGLFALGIAAARWRRQQHARRLATAAPASAQDLLYDRELDEALHQVDLN